MDSGDGPASRARVDTAITREAAKRRVVNSLCPCPLFPGEDPDECLVEGMPAEGLDGRRHAVHVFASIQSQPEAGEGDRGVAEEAEACLAPIPPVPTPERFSLPKDESVG
jgi:hypothetical protein